MNFSIPGLSTDEMVTRLSRRRIYVPGGSACSKGARSHVLTAMGLPEERVASALRVSFCRTNTLEEVDMLAEELMRILKEKQGSGSSLKSKN
jgi:cysteine desulfurase